MAHLSAEISNELLTISLHTTQIDDVIVFLDDLQDSLGELFTEDGFDGDLFPQQRMQHLFILTGRAISNYIKTKLLAEVDCWQGSVENVEQSCKSAIRLCDHWNLSLSDLTGTDWRSRWKGNKYTDKQLVLLSKRISSILSSRLVVEELGLLLSKSERTKFNLDNIFAVFADTPLLAVGSFNEPKWQSAVREFERDLEPAERHAASLLKARIFALAARPQLLVGEFRKFEQLLLRPTVSQELESERETLLSRLLGHLEELRGEFDSGSGARAPPTGKNISDLVSGVVWSHQLAEKVNHTTDIVKRVLPNVNGIERFLNTASDIKLAVEGFAKDLYNRWQDELLDAIRDRAPDLILDRSGKLMDLDINNDGQLKVHYSERLVVLLRETRQLSELGYKIPKEIEEAVMTGQRFYRYGVKLKGVANLYNTMTDQIIPSQLGQSSRQFAHPPLNLNSQNPKPTSHASFAEHPFEKFTHIYTIFRYAFEGSRAF